MIELDRGLREELISLLSDYSPLNTREGRIAWIGNLPSAGRKKIVMSSDHLPTFLANVIDDIGTTQHGGTLLLVRLIDPVIKVSQELDLGFALTLLRDKIVADVDRQRKERDAASSRVAVSSGLAPVIHRSSAESSGLGTPPPDLRKEWLERIGFKHDHDPFRYPDAASDRDNYRHFHQLPAFTAFFGDVFKPQPALVFGATGSGKTSFRRAVSAFCPRRNALPIVCEKLLPIDTRNSETIQDLVQPLLRSALEAILEDAQNGRAVPTASRDNLQNRHILLVYVENCLDKAKLRSEMKRIFHLPKSSRVPVQSELSLGELAHVITLFLGYSSLYFLVDPEPSQYKRPTELASALGTFLGAREIMSPADSEIAFKFFLHEQVEAAVDEITWIRPYVIRGVLKWNAKSLRELIETRLRRSSAKAPPYQGLGELTDNVPDLDDIVINSVGNSPRNVVALCERLFDYHCASLRPGSRNLITQDEVDWVLESFGWRPEPNVVARLVCEKEGSQLEFKATLRADLKTGAVRKDLEEAVAKAICAFMNSEGGTLVIGVRDDGTVQGLDLDLETVAGKNEDGFERALNDVLAAYLDLDYRRSLRVQKETYQRKRVCIIAVDRSHEPIYCRINNESQFYVRNGPASKRLDTQNAVDYILRRFADWVRSKLPLDERAS